MVSFRLYIGDTLNMAHEKKSNEERERGLLASTFPHRRIDVKGRLVRMSKMPVVVTETPAFDALQ